MKFTSLVIVIFMLGSCKAQTPVLKTNKDDNTLLWQVSGNGLKENSYLLGTFHLLCKSDMHFSGQLKQAIKNAREVYMELDMDDPQTLLSGLLVMNMNGGKKLKDLYTPEEYKRLETYFNDSLQTPLTFLGGMKPMMLESLLYPRLLPCRSASGVEEELMAMAKENKKEIQGLESIAFQASIFDSIPYEQQARELLKAIDSIGAYREKFIGMLNVYKSQQLKGLEEVMNDDEFDASGQSDLLLYNRNKNWVSKLNDIMKKERVFVAVGAGHLVGEKGLIALLRKEGYTLTPIDNNY